MFQGATDQTTFEFYHFLLNSLDQYNEIFIYIYIHIYIHVIHVECKIIIIDQIDLSVNVMPTMLCTRSSFAEKATAFTFILSPVIACLARCCLQRCVRQRLWWKAMSVWRLMRRLLEPINPKESKTNQGVSHVVLLKEDVTHHALTYVVANFLNQPSATGTSNFSGTLVLDSCVF